MSVFCYGNAVLDIVVRPAPERPVFGASLHVEAIEQHLGGNGASTAYTLGALGAPVRLFAGIGRDAFGDYLRDRLVSAGVDVSALEYTSASTATSVVLVNTAGERALLHRLGASAEAFAGPLTPPAGATHLHVGAPFAVPNLRRKIPALLKAARRGGAVTSLDTQWDNAGRWMEDLGPSMPFIDFLFVNRFEARMLTGCDDAADAARRFRDAGVRNVVVKLGPDGCALFTPDGDRRWPAFRVPAVDTTGAGDCFAGGFVAALHRGLSLDRAARFASAVAALSVQRIGATEGVLGWDATEAWLRERA